MRERRHPRVARGKFPEVTGELKANLKGRLWVRDDGETRDGEEGIINKTDGFGNIIIWLY